VYDGATPRRADLPIVVVVVSVEVVCDAAGRKQHGVAQPEASISKRRCRKKGSHRSAWQPNRHKQDNFSLFLN
jgi:hypothetical protein